MENDSLTAKLIAIVDDLYAHQVGPIASFICDEAMDNWREREAGTVHYMQISKYIDDLHKELPENKQKGAFIDALKNEKQLLSVNIIKSYLEQF